MNNKKLQSYIRPASHEISYSYFPFSLLSLNLAIGDIRGLRTRRFHQIAGKTTAGKTSLVCDLIGNAQKLDARRTGYVDIECRFDPVYAHTLGVDLMRLDIVYPGDEHNDIIGAEAQLTIAREMLESGEYSIVVLDSIPMLMGETEQEKELDTTENVRYTGQLLGRFIKSVIPIVFARNNMCVMINQMRANQSPMAFTDSKRYGPAIVHHESDVIIELTHKEKVKAGTGDIIQAAVVKNSQTGKKNAVTKYELTYGKGFNITADMLNIAEQYGIITRKGAGWLEFEGIKAQGEDNAAEKFDMDRIRQLILEKVNPCAS